MNVSDEITMIPMR